MSLYGLLPEMLNGAGMVIWLINGTGNSYIEARTRSMGRTDVIVDYPRNQYIVEMKIYHGNEYKKWRWAAEH